MKENVTTENVAKKSKLAEKIIKEKMEMRNQTKLVQVKVERETMTTERAEKEKEKTKEKTKLKHRHAAHCCNRNFGSLTPKK